MIADREAAVGDRFFIAAVLAFIHLYMQAIDIFHWPTFGYASSGVDVHIAGIRYGEQSEIGSAKSSMATSPLACKLQCWVGSLPDISRGSVTLSVIGESRRLPRNSAPELKAVSRDV